MRKAGIIVDLEFTKHAQFKNYYYAMLSLFPNLLKVEKISDLMGLDILFIGNPFHGPNMDIYYQEEFVEECNRWGIKVILVSPEKIMNNRDCPIHVKIILHLSKAEHFYHYTYDVDDCVLLKTKLHRVALSKRYKNYIEEEEKWNKVVFVGSNYSNRRSSIEYMVSNFGMEVVEPNGRSWESYLRILNKYRFVFSPFGDANAFTARFYEILLVHSIPIQQVSENTLERYDIESKFPDCIFYHNLREIPKLISKCTLNKSESEIWYEDCLETLLKENSLL
jgi:hypothetical protein